MIENDIETIPKENIDSNNSPNLFTAEDNITGIKPINIKMDILKFKDDVLKELKKSDNSLNEKYKSLSSSISDKITNFDVKIDLFNDKLAEINSKVIGSLNIHDKVNILLAFKDTTNDYINSNKIKYNMLEKETHNSIHRLDSILQKSVIYPGVIGGSSKFQNFHDFIDFIISDSNTNSNYRDKNTLDLTSYKAKVEKSLRAIEFNIESAINTCNLYTKRSSKEIVEKINNLDEKIKEKIESVRIENSNYIIKIEKETKCLKDEIEVVKSLKDEIFTKLENEVNVMREENKKLNDVFEDYKKLFEKTNEEVGKLRQNVTENKNNILKQIETLNSEKMDKKDKLNEEEFIEKIEELLTDKISDKINNKIIYSIIEKITTKLQSGITDNIKIIMDNHIPKIIANTISNMNNGINNSSRYFYNKSVIDDNKNINKDISKDNFLVDNNMTNSLSNKIIGNLNNNLNNNLKNSASNFFGSRNSSTKKISIFTSSFNKKEIKKKKPFVIYSKDINTIYKNKSETKNDIKMNNKNGKVDIKDNKDNNINKLKPNNINNLLKKNNIVDMNINLKSIVYRQNSPQKFKNKFAIKKSKWSIEKNYFNENEKNSNKEKEKRREIFSNNAISMQEESSSNRNNIIEDNYKDLNIDNDCESENNSNYNLRKKINRINNFEKINKLSCFTSKNKLSKKYALKNFNNTNINAVDYNSVDNNCNIEKVCQNYNMKFNDKFTIRSQKKRNSLNNLNTTSLRRLKMFQKLIKIDIKDLNVQLNKKYRNNSSSSSDYYYYEDQELYDPFYLSQTLTQNLKIDNTNNSEDNINNDLNNIDKMKPSSAESNEGKINKNYRAINILSSPMKNNNNNDNIFKNGMLKSTSELSLQSKNGRNKNLKPIKNSKSMIGKMQNSTAGGDGNKLCHNYFIGFYEKNNNNKEINERNKKESNSNRVRKRTIEQQKLANNQQSKTQKIKLPK